MKLLKHQEKYAHGYKDKELVVMEGGMGKTVCAAVWLKDGRDSDALVICTKRIINKWEAELVKWGTKAKVVSIEQFKKMPARRWSALIVDEADEFASPLFVSKSRSQRTEALYSLISAFPEMPILLLTATPIRSTPWNLHTLLVFRGKYIDWKKWRNEFFSLEYRPYLPRPAWLPKSDWRKKMRPILEKNSDIALLRDCIEDLPPVIEKEIETPTGTFIKNEEWEPAKAFVEEHRNEQKNKVKAILEIAKEYRKVLVVAHYVEQVEALKEELSKDRETFAIWGGVKDQEEQIKGATESDECFFIVQASLGVGFDADTFSCVVFASLSNKARDHVQMKYRVRRIHNLHTVEYNYLLGGRCDKAIWKTIKLGNDFIPSEWGE